MLNDPVNVVDPLGLLSFNGKFQSGLAISANLTISGIVKGKIELNAGNSHYPLFGKNYVSQSLKCYAAIGKWALGANFERKKDGEAHGYSFDQCSRVIPGSGNSIPQILKDTPFKFTPFLGYKDGSLQWAKLQFGAQLLLGFQVEIDFSSEVKFWTNFFND